MDLLTFFIAIGLSGAIGALCLLFGVVQLVRKKESAKIWLFVAAIAAMIFALMYYEIAQVNFGL